MGNNFSFGFHACGRVVKQENMHFLTEGLDRAYRELEQLARGGAGTDSRESSKAGNTRAVTASARPKKTETGGKLARSASTRKKSSPRKSGSAGKK
jgi:hypothetical protein